LNLPDIREMFSKYEQEIQLRQEYRARA
jgi:hypothetical protein